MIYTLCIDYMADVLSIPATQKITGLKLSLDRKFIEIRTERQETNKNLFPALEANHGDVSSF